MVNALVIGAVAVWAFIGGQAAQKWRDRHMAHEEGRRQFHEFLAVATDLGIVTVDRQKLDEIVCIAAEADWESRDCPDGVAEEEDGVRQERGPEDQTAHMPARPTSNASNACPVRAGQDASGP